MALERRTTIVAMPNNAKKITVRTELSEASVIFVADEERIVTKALGLLRLQLGRELDLIDESLWRFLWIVDMAAAEFDETTGTWNAAHHPFTRPTDDSIELKYYE